MKVRKKPVEVEAFLWNKNGDHPEDDVFRPYEDSGAVPVKPREGLVVRYYRTPDMNGASRCGECDNMYHYHGWIDTLEEGHIVCPGDYIITGIRGERYPCKPDIFKNSYDILED